jgi:hypothetical protein
MNLLCPPHLLFFFVTPPRIGSFKSGADGLDIVLCGVPRGLDGRPKDRDPICGRNLLHGERGVID